MGAAIKMSYGNVIEVVGAIIKDGGKYLVGQRAAHKTQGGLWFYACKSF